MDEIICKTIQIGKIYNKIDVLNDVNITINKGEIYGLVGQNGSGKTTLMRLIVGLAKPTYGSIELFNESSNLDNQRSKIGCIIENPIVYPDLSAKDNLEVIRIQKNISNKKCIDEILQLVGLVNTGKKKAKDFSLGMKQRLAMAIALMGQPQFLILDEPINGLDPKGIILIRELLLKINKEKGVTILISSHILTELQHVATCYGFINNGSIIEEISAKDLNDKCKSYIYIKTEDVKKAVVVIEKQLKSDKFEVYPNNIIKLYDFLDDVKKVALTFASENIIVEKISLQIESLENYYLNLIGCNNNV